MAFISSPKQQLMREIEVYRKAEITLVKLREGLIAIAMTDSQLSNNENQIIHTVDVYLPKIRRLLKEIFNDGKVTNEERDQVNDLFRNLMDDAVKTAKFDQILQREENLILMHLRNELITILRELQTISTS